MACNGIEKKKVSLSSQSTDIMIDSIICGINFNDSPERVQTKIKEWASHNTLGEFEYRFIYPQQLNKYAWNYYPRGVGFIMILFIVFSYLLKYPLISGRNVLLI